MKETYSPSSAIVLWCSAPNAPLELVVFFFFFLLFFCKKEDVEVLSPFFYRPKINSLHLSNRPFITLVHPLHPPPPPPVPPFGPPLLFTKYSPTKKWHILLIEDQSAKVSSSKPAPSISRPQEQRKTSISPTSMAAS